MPETKRTHAIEYEDGTLVFTEDMTGRWLCSIPFKKKSGIHLTAIRCKFTDEPPYIADHPDNDPECRNDEDLRGLSILYLYAWEPVDFPDGQYLIYGVPYAH